MIDINIYDKSDEELLNLVLSKKPLSEHTISQLIGDYEIDEDQGDNGRWTQSIYSVIKLCDRTFGISWERGLTEYQDNYYFDDHFDEVIPIEEMVKITKWIPKDQ